MRTRNNLPFVFSEEVHDALNEGRPVVALESNVITHGFKYPQNVETAYRVEQAVRASGAIPATLGLDKGNILIGMDEMQIEKFSTTANIPKVSNRDVAAILSSKSLGATTVASSVLLAELAGIKFFSSAGIGGVHRGAETSMDISADLIQFTRSNMAVVCAGSKSILDLNLTMEYLETHGVPIVSYQFDDFPAFYCKSSNIKSPHREDTLEGLAGLLNYHWQLTDYGSVLITKPIEDKFAIDEAEVNGILAEAIQRAEQEQVKGQAITKFLMQAINQKTEGRTAIANQEVLISNAGFAGELAVAYSQLQDQPLKTLNPA